MTMERKEQGARSVMLILTILCVALAPVARGTQYYVDFSAGLDTNSGTASSAAWKHCPGDPAATGNANRTLQAGDTVLFKGGVVYRGGVKLNSSGALTNPVTYKGDGWGSSKAIIDGSEVLTGAWTKCQSSADCGGNPNWAHIYYTYVPATPSNLTIQRALFMNLCQDDQVLYPAQHPNPPDPLMGIDDLSSYLSIPPANATATSIVDSRFASLGGASLVGCYVFVWRQGNLVDFRKITGYVAAETKIIFDELGGPPYSDRNVLYALADCQSALDREGEYVFTEAAEANGTHKVYLWPLGDKNPATSEMTISTRTYGFDIYGANNVVIEGFKIQKQTGDSYGEGPAVWKSPSPDTSGIVVRGNEMTKLRVSSNDAIDLRGVYNTLLENNYIHDLPRMKGITLVGASSPASTNITVKGNTLRRLGSTCIYMNVTKHGEIINNTLSDCNGVHGNGMSVYQGCSDILIAGNTVTNCNYCITLSDSSNLTLYNNVLNGVGKTGYVLKTWSGVTGDNSIINCVIVGSNTRAALALSGTATWHIKNSIIDGFMNEDVVNPDKSYNIYTNLAWNQDLKSLGVNEVLDQNTGALFVDYANYNFRLKTGSRAIDAGLNATSLLPVLTFPDYNFARDADGATRPQGLGWDIGAYEYASGTPGISIGDISVAEGNSGGTNAVFTVSLSAISDKVVTVNYATMDGTAMVAAGDYVQASGPISFLAGETNKTIAVVVNGDTTKESNENFYVNLSSPVNATISRAQGKCDIMDDDSGAVSGLMGYWKLDEGLGTQAADSSGNGNTGSLLNGPAWTAGQINGALSFDGVDDCVNVGAGNFNLTSELTVALWVKITGTVGSSYSTLIGKDQYVHPFVIQYGNADHKIKTVVRTSTADYLYSNTALSLNAWHHVALTYKSGARVLYINGAADNSNGLTGNLSLGDFPTELGAISGTNYLKGALDDVRIYNVALSAAEILALYNAGAGATNHPPSFTGATLAPIPAYKTSTLSVACTGWSDSDGDPEAYHYQWKKNATAITGATNATLSGAFLRGDSITCSVTAWDGKVEGNTILTPASAILNSPPAFVAPEITPIPVP